MIKLTILIFFSLNLFQLSSQSLTELNKEFQAYNEKLKDGSKALIEEVQNFTNDLKSDLSEVQNFSEACSLFPVVIEKIKSIDLNFFQDLKTCDDLKYRNATTLLNFNKFNINHAEIMWSFEQLKGILKVMDEEYEKDKKFIDGKVEGFSDKINSTKLQKSFNNFTNIFGILKTFNDPKLQKLIADELKSCDCPTQESLELPSDLKSSYDQISVPTEKLIADAFTNLSIAVSRANREINRGDIKFFLDNLLHCTFDISSKIHIYTLNLDDKNGCGNLEQKIADLNVKLWRTSDIIKKIKSKASTCVENGKKVVESRLSDFSSSEKSLMENVKIALEGLEPAMKEHLSNLENSVEKIEKVYKEMINFRDVNCKCKKKDE